MAHQEARRKRDRAAADCVRLGKIATVRTCTCFVCFVCVVCVYGSVMDDVLVVSWCCRYMTNNMSVSDMSIISNSCY